MSAAAVELNEPDAALHQPARDQTVSAELAGHRAVYAVRLQRRGRLVRQVDGLRHLGLHSVGQLVALDSRRQLRAAGPRVQVLLVDARQQIELAPLLLRGRRAVQVQHRVADGPEQRALVGGGHEAARPVRLAADRAAAVVHDHHIARQVLVLGPEAVGRPASQRRPADENAAGVHRHERGAVRVAIGIAGADERQLVGVLPEVREVVADHQAALAAGPKLAPLRRQEALFSTAGVGELEARRKLLPRILRQRRLVVEGIDMAGRAVHHQEDHTLDAGREVGRLRGKGRQWTAGFDGHAALGFWTTACLIRGGVAGEEAVCGEEGREREAGEAAAHLPDELAARLAAGVELPLRVPIGHSESSLLEPPSMSWMLRARSSGGPNASASRELMSLASIDGAVMARPSGSPRAASSRSIAFERSAGFYPYAAAAMEPEVVGIQPEVSVVPGESLPGGLPDAYTDREYRSVSRPDRPLELDSPIRNVRAADANGLTHIRRQITHEEEAAAPGEPGLDEQFRRASARRTSVLSKEPWRIGACGSTDREQDACCRDKDEGYAQGRSKPSVHDSRATSRRGGAPIRRGGCPSRPRRRRRRSPRGAAGAAPPR